MKLQDRLEDGLNELRIVLLGGQVLAAFAYKSCFQSGFELLPSRVLWVQATAITVITLLLDGCFGLPHFIKLRMRGW